MSNRRIIRLWILLLVLILATDAGRAELRVTERQVDGSGRVTDVFGGPAQAGTDELGLPASVRTRDGVAVAMSYDVANRLLAAVPSSTASLASSLAPLDGGDAFAYDPLSRPTLFDRPGDPSAAVRVEGYDLASRPSGERVGTRSPLSWRYDAWDRPTDVTLAASALGGFRRSFDSVDRVVDVGAVTPGAAVEAGATWGWGGAARLYGTTTKTPLGTAARYGYVAGRGPAPPPGSITSGGAQWRLGTMEWGSASLGSPVTASPAQVWGDFGYGYRGSDGDPRDGVRLGRVVGFRPQSLDLFAGMGWAWGYDAGVRLQTATPGQGDVAGRAPPSDDRFGYEYGKGDELERIVREGTAEVADLELGPQGRILSRGGVEYAYDPSGRRTEDDRLAYRWTWRGELASVTVKPTWPGGETPPHAGHQVRYGYDALGRLSSRLHLGPLPGGETDDALRPLVERRVLVWEGQSLLLEEGYGAGEQLRWRRTYVPGPAGLDDAVQVSVEIVSDPSSPLTGTTRLYTYLRDEQGTVVGIVAEQEGSDPTQPPIAVRYFFTPYGEAHAELGPELRSARFDVTLSAVAGVAQDVADATLAARGGLRVRLSLPVNDASLATSFVVETRAGSAGPWSPVSPTELILARRSDDPSELQLLLVHGWLRGNAYRIRLGATLADAAGRPLGIARDLEWSVPLPTLDTPEPAVRFEETYPLPYATHRAASATLQGRFPGGQPHLFQGLWTDPVTGVAYARARWYDPRNAGWLSEDPLEDVDSPSLYAFVGHQPNLATDPTGEIALVDNIIGGVVGVAVGIASAEACSWMSGGDGGTEDPCNYTLADAAVDFGLGFASSGISSMSKLGRLAVDVGAEVVRAKLKGQEISAADLGRGIVGERVIGTAAGAGIRTVGAVAEVGAEAFGKLAKAVDPGGLARGLGDAARSVGRRGGDVALRGGSAPGPGPQGLRLRLEFVEGMDKTEFMRHANRIQKAIDEDRAFSNLAHGVSDASRRSLTRSYRRRVAERINSFYASNPTARENALRRLRGSDIDHILDLQLSGGNVRSNLKALHSFTNQVMGSQISRQLPLGQRIPIIGLDLVGLP